MIFLNNKTTIKFILQKKPQGNSPAVFFITRLHYKVAGLEVTIFCGTNCTGIRLL